MTTITNLSSTKFKWNEEAHKFDRVLVSGTIKLEIDVEKILSVLGHKALVNKTGKAVDLNGLVKATRI